MKITIIKSIFSNKSIYLIGGTITVFIYNSKRKSFTHLVGKKRYGSEFHWCFRFTLTSLKFFSGKGGFGAVR